MFDKLALTLPFGTPPPGETGASGARIPAPEGFIFANDPAKQSLGYVISQSLEVVFTVVGIILFVMLVMAAMQYIFAGGDKEKLGKARGRITTAIIGFVLVILSFAISQFIQQTLSPQSTGITEVSEPPPISNTGDGSNSICTREIISDCESRGDKCVINNGKAECGKR